MMMAIFFPKNPPYLLNRIITTKLIVTEYFLQARRYAEDFTWIISFNSNNNSMK